MLKLEMFFQDSADGCVYFDADMLVLASPAIVAQTLYKPLPAALSWALHGADEPRSRDVQGGHLAFRAPVPDDVRAAILRTSETFARRAENMSVPRQSRYGPEKGDQDIINIALRAVDTAHYPERYRSRRVKVKPVQLLQHADWFTNNFPTSTDDLQRLRVLHWAGLPKPWVAAKSGGKLAFSPNPSCHASCRRMLPATRELWQSHCNRTASRAAAAASKAIDAAGPLVECGQA